MLNSSLCDCINAYMLVKRTKAVDSSTAAASDRNNKQLIFKSFAPLTDCISEIHNKKVDKVKKY